MPRKRNMASIAVDPPDPLALELGSLHEYYGSIAALSILPFARQRVGTLSGGRSTSVLG